MSKKYEGKVLEICENGDAVIELPLELLEDNDWRLDDVLDVKLVDGVVIFENLSKQKREKGI